MVFIEMILDPQMLGPSWYPLLKEEFQKPYFKALESFLNDAYRSRVIYPKESLIFRAFRETPLEGVKAVILGQDPYHGEGQAEGLSFSVPIGCPPPPSLVNIFKEIESDLQVPRPSHGSLVHWAKQGVLLLNTILTVEAAQAKSHHQKGWELFTDRVIQILVEEQRPIVFILWGSSAREKYRHIESKMNPLHCVLTSAHPSPLSAYAGFFGSKPFSKTNAFLKKHGIQEIDWRIP